MYDEVATHCSMGEHYADRFALPVFLSEQIGLSLIHTGTIYQIYF